MQNEIALEVKNLKKNYGSTRAIDDLSFQVEKGEIFGLLGPNGAGKTTTLECVEGLRKQDEGTISVLGIDPGSHKKKLWDKIGVQLQTSALPATMTSKEAIAFFCHYHGKKPNMEILHRFGLSNKMSDQYGNLSVGQKRRLALALSVAHEPEILFLDEPTAGLDVESRIELHLLLREIKEEGKTIILATHDMAEAEKLCSTLAIIINGKLAVLGTPAQVTAAGDRRSKITVATAKGSIMNKKPQFPGAEFLSLVQNYVHYNSEDSGKTIQALLRFLEEQGDELLDLRVERPSLEERFMEITRDRRNTK